MISIYTFDPMILLNEHDFNNRDVLTASGRDNLTVGERRALKQLHSYLSPQQGWHYCSPI